MSDFFLSFIRSSLDLFNIELFSYVFVAFLSLFALYLIKFVIWGR